MKLTAHSTCPYCGVHKRHILAEYPDRLELTYCDGDDGGCGKYYAVRFDIEVTSEAHKIEGEQEA